MDRRGERFASLRAWSVTVDRGQAVSPMRNNSRLTATRPLFPLMRPAERLSVTGRQQSDFWSRAFEDWLEATEAGLTCLQSLKRWEEERCSVEIPSCQSTVVPC